MITNSLRERLAEVLSKHDPFTVSRTPANPYRYQGSKADADLIAAEDPAAVLRQCERDLKALARHRPRLVPGAVGVQCDTCEPPDWRWPCIEITDLADAYVIPVDATAGQTPGGTDGR